MKQSLYVYRKVLNVKDIRDWFEEQNLSFTDSPHVTIAYSKAKVYWEDLEFDKKNIRIKGGQRSIESFDDSATVLKFQSDLLTTRWSYFLENGCSWDYKEYKPHMTITYSYKGDVKFLKPYKGEILLGPEYHESLKTDWTDK